MSNVVPFPGAGQAGSYFTPMRTPLTEREAEVMAMRRAGMTRAEIAKALGCAASTVKAHVRHINGKLGITGAANAAHEEYRPMTKAA